MSSTDQGTVIAEVSAGVTALTVAEQQDLERHEAVIARGIDTFVEVGLALAAIRDGKLYRATHRTFDDYCRTRWDMGGKRAYQLIGAAVVVENVSTTVDTAPKNEAQVRPLAGLSPDEQRAAWQEAVETAPQGKVTGTHVQQVVERRRDPPAQAKPAPAVPPGQAAPATLPQPLPGLSPSAAASPALPPPLPGLAPAPLPAGASGQVADPIVLQTAVLARLLSAAAARCQRDWDAIMKGMMDRGQYPVLTVGDDQVTLAALQLIDSPAVKAAASLMALGASFTIEPLDGTDVPVTAEEPLEEVIA